MKKKTLYNPARNKEFAENNNFDTNTKYIQLHSNIDNFGKNEFTLWFFHAYHNEIEKTWKGQSYYANVKENIERLESEGKNVVVLESKFK